MTHRLPILLLLLLITLSLPISAIASKERSQETHTTTEHYHGEVREKEETDSIIKDVHASNSMQTEDHAEDGHAEDDHGSGEIGRLGWLSLLFGVLIALFSGAIFFVLEGALSKPLGSVLAMFTGATAGIHLLIGFFGRDILLLLNGAGYLGLLGLLLIPAIRPYAKWILFTLAGYTVATIIGYFLTGHSILHDPLGLITKLDEVGLLIVAAILLLSSPVQQLQR